MGSRCFNPHPTLGSLGFSASIEDRFWQKVFVMTYDCGCWLWIGSRQKFGHGHIGKGKNKHGLARAHIVSWLLHNGPIPNGLWVLHKCDNPQCVNPNHLYLGTASDNNRDASIRGRNSHKLTKEQVLSIRSEYPALTHKQLGEKYGVNAGTIFHVVHHNTWRHVV